MKISIKLFITASIFGLLLVVLIGSGQVIAGVEEQTSSPVETQEPVNPYFSSTIITTKDGRSIEADTINGPPAPPPGYEIERASIALPAPDETLSVNSLSVPAYDWVFGCSAVSAAMIAGYYDNTGYPNMYTGLTNGEVAPYDSSLWSYWTDGYDVYPNNPLVASHMGLDSRATRGSIDDYWVRYNSNSPDPYITGGWSQHTWGTAVGDYMKTSQSAYNNSDGSTHFYNWPSSSTPLTCSDMEYYGVSTLDGTYGRKLFYQARGYTVTNCYNQLTDNQIYGGFSFAQFRAEIDAGWPVLLNLIGHSIVGVGYDANTNIVYLHDTWDNQTHTMPWGGSYQGMLLRSVSVVHLASPPLPPGQFQKISPDNGATAQPTTLTLSWTASSGASSYEYCYDTVNDLSCSNWISVGAETSVALSGLSNNTPYEWQVRAKGVGGTAYANGNIINFWSFTTEIAPPGAFNKISPVDGTTGLSTSPVLDWENSAGATEYLYCIDTNINNLCDVQWKSTGTASQVQLSGLVPGTHYEWQVLATNAKGAAYADGLMTASWDFTTEGVPPPGPFNKISPCYLGAQPTNPILTWGISTGSTEYEYCIDTTDDDACSNWMNVGTDTSVYLAGLNINAAYFWQVRATNQSGTTYANTYDTSFCIFYTGSTATFGKLSPTDGVNDLALDVILTWQPLPGASSYEYCVENAYDYACSNWVNVGQNTSAQLSGLSYATAYYWQVRALIGGGSRQADNGTYWSFTTIIERPGPFKKLSPVDGATELPVNNLILDWEESNRADHFEYCLDAIVNNTCDIGWINTGQSSEVVLNGLSYLTEYEWQVRASDAGGTTYANDSESTFWRFTTKQVPAPGAFNKLVPTDGAIGIPTNPLLDWQDSAGVVEYQFCYDTNINSACDTSWISTGTISKAQFNGLSNLTVYEWQVRATNLGGTTYANGSETDYWQFTIADLPTFDKLAPVHGSTGIAIYDVLSWQPVAGVIRYEYCIDESNDNACSNWVNAGQSTSIAPNELKNSTTYYWQVRAVFDGGMSYANHSLTSFWNFTTIAEKKKVFLPITIR